jgi:3-oxoacyl-[acyl-carrier-protein] synthase III
VLASVLGTSRRLGHSTRLKHPGVTGARETIEFMASNKDMSSLAMSTLVRAAREALDGAGITLAEIAWVVPHQPNGKMLEGIVAALGADPARVVPIVQEIGSVGAASIPMSLDRLFRTRDVRPGDRILLVGVGAGVSFGAIVYQVAA